MSQTKFVALLAGAAVSVGAVSSTMAQTQVDRAADAERLASTMGRSSLQGTGSGDTLKVGGLIQFAYTADFRSSGTHVATTGKDGKYTGGFSNNVTKLWVGGTVGDSNLSYKLQGNFDSSGGTFTLDDAYFEYKLNDQFGVKAGQFKMPLLHEETVADQYQLAAKRSFTNSVFTASRSQNAQLNFTQDNFRAMGGFTDGWRSKNTDFNSANESDYGLYARAEFKWAGDWSRFDDFTSFKGDGYAGMVGASILFQSNGSNGYAGDTVVGGATHPAGANFLLYSVDASMEGDGWNLYGAFIGSSFNPRQANEATTDNFGLVFQGGYFLNDNWEVFGRWDAIFADKNIGSNGTPGSGISPKNFNFLTAGLNYYLIPKKHTFKLTVDAVLALTKTDGLIGTNVMSGGGGGAGANTNLLGSGSAAPYTGGSVLGDVKGGELGLQIQAQVLF